MNILPGVISAPTRPKQMSVFLGGTKFEFSKRSLSHASGGVSLRSLNQESGSAVPTKVISYFADL